jgi:hypothetical protein
MQELVQHLPTREARMHKKSRRGKTPNWVFRHVGLLLNEPPGISRVARY